MSVAGSEWPVVGATGARFGPGRSRRRRRPADHDVASRGDHAVGPVSVGGEEQVGDLPAMQAYDRTRSSGSSVGNEDMDQPVTSSFVRPFVRSGGRTRAEIELPLEALVSAVPSALGNGSGSVMEEHRLVLSLCVQPRSIMEIAALAGIPLGVARVLVGDLAATGELTVHRTVDRVGPGVELLERVLTGLHEL